MGALGNGPTLVVFLRPLWGRAHLSLLLLTQPPIVSFWVRSHEYESSGDGPLVSHAQGMWKVNTKTRHDVRLVLAVGSRTGLGGDREETYGAGPLQSHFRKRIRPAGHNGCDPQPTPFKSLFLQEAKKAFGESGSKRAPDVLMTSSFTSIAHRGALLHSFTWPALEASGALPSPSAHTRHLLCKEDFCSVRRCI